MTLWLGVVLLGTGHRGSRRQAARRRAGAVHPPVQRGPAESALPPHLLHVRVERGRHVTRVLNIAGLIDAIVHGTWRMRADLRRRGISRSPATCWALGALGWLPRVKRSTQGRRPRAPLLLRIGLGGLHRAAGAVAAVEGPAADAHVRPAQARDLLGPPRLRRQPRAARPAAAHAADSAGESAIAD